MTGGVAVLDYNRDGDRDIFLANGANIETLRKDAAKYANRLLRNDGRGNFADVTEKAGLVGTGYETGVAAGDFDSDGYLDLFVAGVHRTTLYRNRRDGAFEDVTARAGLSAGDREYRSLWAVGAAWLDAKNDGCSICSCDEESELGLHKRTPVRGTGPSPISRANRAFAPIQGESCPPPWPITTATA